MFYLDYNFRHVVLEVIGVLVVFENNAHERSVCVYIRGKSVQGQNKSRFYKERKQKSSREPSLNKIKGIFSWLFIDMASMDVIMISIYTFIADRNN